MSLNRLPSAAPIGIFPLPEHRLLIPKHGRDDSAKCDAHHTHDPSDTVLGKLYESNEEEKFDRDRAEGLGNGYEEKIIKVFNTKSSIKAITYYATNLSNTLKPFTWYKEHVLTDAQETNLSKEYIGTIEAVLAAEDYDKEREAEQFSIHY